MRDESREEDNKLVTSGQGSSNGAVATAAKKKKESVKGIYPTPPLDPKA